MVTFHSNSKRQVDCLLKGKLLFRKVDFTVGGKDVCACAHCIITNCSSYVTLRVTRRYLWRQKENVKSAMCFVTPDYWTATQGVLWIRGLFKCRGVLNHTGHVGIMLSQVGGLASGWLVYRMDPWADGFCLQWWLGTHNQYLQCTRDFTNCSPSCNFPNLPAEILGS